MAWIFLNFFMSTYVVLIPKCDNLKCLNDFRLINLCSTFNKIISKILASKMGLFFPKIIFVNQSGLSRGEVSLIM
ncbi:hypothetical protein KFK09_027857 [Dendrobium nobile]|uniref:Uncharacterized protein n=1 Tax=Dendrobium nobile TaxID=94219 RepID=A0A8T3A5R9_DENNO|nr:hypothetical protein KFK09_027857 [Dendrobium nobile]